MNTSNTECPCPTAACEHSEQYDPEHDTGYRGNHAPGSFLAKRDLRPLPPTLWRRVFHLHEWVTLGHSGGITSAVEHRRCEKCGKEQRVRVFST